MTIGERAIAIRVTGRVQGVNYRNYTKQEAERLGLRGWVVNCDDGSVEAAFHGPADALGKIVEICRRGPPHADVEGLDVRSTDRGHVDEPPGHAYTF